MAIRFKKVSRLSDPTNQDSVKRTYPIISYKYDTPATLKEVAQEISGNSGVSEGETISVLMFKDLDRLNDEGTDAPSGGDGEGEDPAA